MSSSVYFSKTVRSLRRRRARHAAHEQCRTILAKAPGVHATAGLLAAIIVTITPVVEAAVAGSSENSSDEFKVISGMLMSPSQSKQQDLANMASSQLRPSVLADRAPMQLGPNSVSPDLPEEDVVQIAGVPQSMQGAAAEVASAAGVALRNAQEVEQSFEAMLSDTSVVPSYGDVQQALGDALHSELGPDATNAVLGLGSGILALLGVVAVQVQQRQKSENGLQDEIKSLQNVKSKLENRLSNLDQNKVSLEASLTMEKEEKTNANERADQLEMRLKESTQNLDAKTAEQELTSAMLRDNQKALDKEKVAGTALGEQVIDLSRQVEQQTARALKAEDVSGQLQKELSTRERELSDERKKTLNLESNVKKLEGNVEDMTAAAQQQAAAVQDLRESASEAKTAADAAYQRVSTQLQLSMDQAKSLKKSLAQTDTALKKSQDGAMKLEEELKHMRAKAEGLQMRLDTTASDLQKAHDAIEQQQSTNSILKADNAAMQDRIKKLSSTLEATTLRLSSEVDVASDMKSQLAELKLEYIAAGDKLEAEQTHIKELQVDLRNMESALNAVSHDKKAAIMENAQLAAQLEGSQKSLMAAELGQQKTETDLANAQSMATDLQQQLAAFESEMQAVIERSQTNEAELEKERSDRTAMEAQVDALKRQVVSIEQAERTAREQAQAAVVELRQEIEAARTRKRAMTKPIGVDSGTSVKVPAMAQPQTSSTQGGSSPAVTDSKRSKSS